MGMDSRVFGHRGEPTIDGEGGWIYLDEIELGCWRNHRQLHCIIEDIHESMTGERDINTKAVELDLGVIDWIEEKLNDGDLLRYKDGSKDDQEERVLMGHFIASSRKALADGYTVRYWCWY